MDQMRGERRPLRATRHHGGHRRGALEPASTQCRISLERERRSRRGWSRHGLGKRPPGRDHRVRRFGVPQNWTAIETLEEEASGLGAAFYWTLTNAIYRVMRIYNHDDAFEYEERMKEYAEEEDNPEQYGF